MTLTLRFRLASVHAEEATYVQLAQDGAVEEQDDQSFFGARLIIPRRSFGVDHSTRDWSDPLPPADLTLNPAPTFLLITVEQCSVCADGHTWSKNAANCPTCTAPVLFDGLPTPTDCICFPAVGRPDVFPPAREDGACSGCGRRSRRR